jgi:hypothetical protein
MPKSKSKYVTGVLESITVKGMGPNSAEIVIGLIDAGGTKSAYAVYAYPTTEPSVFSSFATLLTAAYLTKSKVFLEYVPVSGPTPQIVGLTMPA